MVEVDTEPVMIACIRAVMPDSVPSSGASNSMIGVCRERMASMSAVVSDGVVIPTSCKSSLAHS